jgi:hypothetical protein
MITQKGTLPVGLKKDGKYHRDFEIRPSLIKDSIEVADEQEPAKLKNWWFANIALTAKQIVRIGEVSPVPLEDFVGMLDVDMQAISAAQEILAVRLGTFHDADAGDQPEDSGDVRSNAGEPAQGYTGTSETEVSAAGGT